MLAQLLTDVKAASLAALAAGSRPAPGVTYISEGDVAYDNPECSSSMIVAFESVTGLTTSSQTAQTAFLAPLVTVAVHLLRCAAPPGPESTPAPAEIESSGLELLADLSALLGTSLDDCRPLQLLSGTLPRATGGDLGVVLVRWAVVP